ncbi:MAG: hypothetical protein A3G18_06940 [Rhodospirillales bacterium RIFCSPLOWO2_12_FULL_58_28]|nr:MAG: hypothetical protein A3H92_11505 [Rhodospirillales bacterium RIFCSPLOWO2_02_FULL_58_16]OHC77456.1 MAG: hypothetical protein A3G18_06940 [Rhodospirillales bacterium RIFCSPLOWO2_12_FULL_58_28]
MAKPDDKPFKNLRVLIVDDSGFICRILLGMLHELSVREVREAKDGADALAAIKSGFWPNLIITDFEMPGIDGVEFTRTVRTGKDISIHEVPIILITSFADASHVQMARNAGVSEFLAKPFSLEMLVSRMHAAIDRPRPFVESSVFTGPDRRRKWELDFDGEEHRKNKISEP